MNREKEIEEFLDKLKTKFPFVSQKEYQKNKLKEEQPKTKDKQTDTSKKEKKKKKNKNKDNLVNTDNGKSKYEKNESKLVNKPKAEQPKTKDKQKDTSKKKKKKKKNKNKNNLVNTDNGKSKYEKNESKLVNKPKVEPSKAQEIPNIIISEMKKNEKKYIKKNEKKEKKQKTLKDKLLEDKLKNIIFNFDKLKHISKKENENEKGKKTVRTPKQLRIVEEIRWVDNLNENKKFIREKKENNKSSLKEVILYNENTKKKIGKVIYKTSKISFMKELYPKKKTISRIEEPIMPEQPKNKKSRKKKKSKIVKIKTQKEEEQQQKKQEEFETNQFNNKNKNFKEELIKLTKGWNGENSIKRKYQRKNDVERCIALLNRKYYLENNCKRIKGNGKNGNKLKKKIKKHTFQLLKKYDSMHSNDISAMYKRNYSYHALKKMKSRWITFINVENAINNGIKILNEDPFIIYKKNTLTVITSNGTVITTYRNK